MNDRFFAVAYFTFRESLARKTFLGFFAISSLTLAILLFAVNLDIVDGALSGVSIFGAQADRVPFNLDELVFRVESGIAGALYTAGILLSIFTTASLVPNMLQKGHIDWLLSKPVGRPQLLAGRYAGGLGVVAFNIIFLIAGSWFILSLKTGVWNPAFLVSGLVIIAMFAVLFALMVLVGVLLQNSAVSIMAAYLVIFLSPMLLGREQLYAVVDGRFYQLLIEGIYYITPRVPDVGVMVTRLVIDGSVPDWSPLLHSLLIGAGYFALAVLVFRRKDF